MLGIPGLGQLSPQALAALPQSTWKPAASGIPNYQAFIAQKPTMLGTRTQGPGYIDEGTGSWRTPDAVWSNPQDKANYDAYMKWGHDNNIFPGSGGGFMETLSNKIIPGVIQAGTVAGIGAGVGGAFGVGPLAPGAATAAPAAGAAEAASGAASGLGGASGAVGATTVPAGTGLAGGLTGASGAALGTGGLETGVGVGAGTAGTALGSGMTSGAAAAGSAATGGGTSGGFGNFMNSLFGPGAAAPTAASLSAMGLGGALGQTVLDLYEANKRRQAAGTAAGLADPFASQRGQYQTQLSNLMANPNSIVNDPSYKFRLDQGQQALERSNVAKGYLGSGNMPIDLINYGQGAASQELNNQKSFLANLAGANIGNPGAAASAYGTGMNNSLAQQYQGLSDLGTAGRLIYNRYNSGSGAIV